MVCFDEYKTYRGMLKSRTETMPGGSACQAKTSLKPRKERRNRPMRRRNPIEKKTDLDEEVEVDDEKERGRKKETEEEETQV